MAIEFFTAALPNLYAQNQLTGRMNSIADSLTNPLGIERFKSALNQFKIQPSNLYRVTIAMPRVFSLSYEINNSTQGFIGEQSDINTRPSNSDMTQMLGFFCTDINLPGISLASTEIRRYGTGPIQRIPYSPIFADTTFTFLADGTGSIHTFYMEWMRRIVNYSRGQGSMFSQLGSKGEPYEVEYKSEYMSPGIQIEIFDKTGARTQVIVMYEAYPLNIGEVTMSYAENDSIARIPVTFTFRDFQVVFATGTELFFSANGGRDVLGQFTTDRVFSSQPSSDAVAAIRNAANLNGTNF